MKHRVEVRIPAVIVLRGSAEGKTPAGARRAAAAEARRLAKEFSGHAILEGSWPEALGGAKVVAEPVRGKIEAATPWDS